MVDQININSADLERYARILKLAFGEAASFSIIDEIGNIAWETSGVKSISLQQILGLEKTISENSQAVADKIVQFCPKGFQPFVKPLDLEYIDSQHYFIIISPVCAHETTQVETKDPIFSDICILLGRQINLSIENNQMVEELSRHYEELNLIYQTEELLKKDTMPADILLQVVRDVSQFMEVDAAFVFIPEMERWIFYTDPGADFVNTQSIIKTTISNFYTVMKEDCKTIVLNRKEAIVLSDLSPSERLMMVLCPLLNFNNELMGIIGCVRRLGRKDFVTGERKLIEAISQRARKVILLELDQLTGLMTRSSFENQLNALLSRPSIAAGRLTVSFVNIDQFKLLNDAYGMVCADDILRQVGKLLRNQLGSKYIIARLESDQFGLIYTDAHPHGDGIREILEQVRSNIENYAFVYGDKTIHITVRIGYVCPKKGRDSMHKAISSAEIAVQEAKEKGGNCTVFSSIEDKKIKAIVDKALYATQIEKLVEQSRFLLFSQPIIPLTGGKLHYEILLRLKAEDNSIISPYQFLPAAEAYRKMTTIDRWVIENTCQKLAESQSVLKPHQICWGINLSGQSLQDESFVNYFLNYLSKLAFPVSWLYFEITETVAIQNFTQVINVIEQVRKLGFKIALDDFGTGYSSFEYLQKLPVSFLKIDGAFIKDLPENSFNQVAVKSMVSIARHLNIKTIAEFVENENILKQLKLLGVDYSQGYHTGRPGEMSDAIKQYELLSNGVK